MTLLVLGLNHQTAPLGLRERVAFDADALPAALSGLRALPGVAEVALLSTCGRTEIYAVAVAGADGADALTAWLADCAAGDLTSYLYSYRDTDAARHLFRVASGLDSMVLGEPQILGQVKAAWQAARAAGALSGTLDRLFQRAFAVAKRARSETAIGLSPVSVATAAVRLAQRSFARLPDSTVLLIGAGETIELAARHVSEGGVRRLLVANRTLAHAQELAGRHGGFALALADLDRHLDQADVVLSATASREPILHKAQVQAALQRRRHRPMLLIDLAVPRDIAADVAQLEDAYLYTVDDLERAAEDGRSSRRDAAAAAEAIAGLEAARFQAGLDAAGRRGPCSSCAPAPMPPVMKCWHWRRRNSPRADRRRTCSNWSPTG